MKGSCLRYFILFAVLLITGMIKAQDTLFFNNGDVKAVKIVSIDEYSNLIVYVSEGDTIYSSDQKIKELIIHSQVKYIELKETAFAKIDSNTAVQITPGVFGIQHKYNFGKLGIGINLLPLFGAGQNNDIFVSSNSNLVIFGHYSPYEHLGIELETRIGLSRETPPIGIVNYQFNLWDNNQETIFEIELAPLIYFNKRTAIICVYLKPGYAIGQNLGINRTTFINRYDPSQDYSTSYSEQFTRNYWRGSLGLGIQYNAWKSFTIGCEFEAFRWNGTGSTFIDYENSSTDPTYYKTYEYDYGSRNVNGITGRLSIMYRFGSTKIKNKDK